MLERVERWLAAAYRLALILGVLAVALAAVHARGARSADVVWVSGETVEVRGSTDGVSTGRDIAIYRYNSGWTQPIGWVRVSAVSEGGFTAEVLPGLHWPLGVHGLATTRDDHLVEVAIPDAPLAPRDTLTVFEARRRTGQLQVLSVEPDRVVARRVQGSVPPGAVASGYSVATQAAWFHAPGLAAAEWLATIAALALWAWGVVSDAPGRALAAVRRLVIAGYHRGGAPLNVVVQLALGALLVPIAARLGWHTLLYVVHAAGQSTPSLRGWTDQAIWAGTVAGGALWVGLLARTGRAPAPQIWRWLRFRPRGEGLPPWLRGGLVWALHLVVFYAFGRTLTGFLTGNTSAMLKLGWDRPNLVRHLADIPAGLGHMVTHAPHLASWDDGFVLARLALWSLTISGCLVGYGHTVVSILWKREPIRNIDFTPVAWIVNAICYGPLLGGVLYRLHDSPPAAVDPGLVGGPAWGVQLVAELLLNLLYTLSIWNLGTRFGVMVDKGVQTRGFYSVVRHPSYTLEALMFVVLGLGGYATGWHFALAMLWPIKYFMRSERDDQFMGASNPDYVRYREQVRWKYVPGLL